MSAAEERLANDPSSELWGEHRSRYRFAIELATGRLRSPHRGDAAAQRSRMTTPAPPGSAPSAAAERSSTAAAAQADAAPVAGSRVDARWRGPLSGHVRSEGQAPAAVGSSAVFGGAGGHVRPKWGAEFGARGVLAGLAVLDVACGSGFGMDMLGQAGATSIGVDYDHAALGEVRRLWPAARLLRGDGMRLALRDASVDLVISFETIEHVSDGQALVCELRRVLKPGGRLVLSTPNRLFGPAERHTSNPFHVREFSADELRDLLRASFKDVQLFGQRPSPAYRYVPFLMLHRDTTPSALAWKLLLRLPFAFRNGVALALGGRPFYPTEDDYRFVAEDCDGAHTLVAVAA